MKINGIANFCHRFFMFAFRASYMLLFWLYVQFDRSDEVKKKLNLPFIIEVFF